MVEKHVSALVAVFERFEEESHVGLLGAVQAMSDLAAGRSPEQVVEGLYGPSYDSALSSESYDEAIRLIEQVMSQSPHRGTI